jgi:hypothetical protein
VRVIRSCPSSFDQAATYQAFLRYMIVSSSQI